jgi:hypothetical protein
MPRSLKLLLLCGLIVLLAGCASDGSLSNPFASNTAAPAGGHFFSEFEDIAVPNEMREVGSDTVIIIAPSGLKTGMQRFKGRVEVVSLMNTMRRHMANHGWTLRSLLRAQRSMMIFEKPDRMAFIEITEGLLDTEMRIVVFARLAGDSPTMDVRTYSATGVQRLSQ